MAGRADTNEGASVAKRLDLTRHVRNGLAADTV